MPFLQSCTLQALKGHIVWRTLSVTRLMGISQGTSANEMKGKKYCVSFPYPDNLTVFLLDTHLQNTETVLISISYTRPMDRLNSYLGSLRLKTCTAR